MLPLEHYLRLRRHYTEAINGEPFRVALDELSSVLGCTRRNVNFVLKHLEDEAWIRWTPGRGRGHMSSLAFLAEPEELVRELAARFAADGDADGANALLSRNAIGREAGILFAMELKARLGLTSEVRQGKRRDVLRLPYRRGVVPFDPALPLPPSERHIASQLFHTLTSYDEAARAVRPQLAHHWNTDDGGAEWTFYLRKGVRFHHGKALTAADAAFSVQRLAQQPDHPFRLDSVHAVSDTCLRVRLTEADPLLPLLLASPRAAIMPMELEDEEHGFRPVGTGPFKLIRNDETVLVLEAESGCFRERPLIDTVELWRLPHNDEDAERPPEGIYVLAFRCIEDTDRPQRDRPFRKALHHGLDRERLAAELGERSGDIELSAACALLPQPDKRKSKQPYDPSRARRLLDKSGYTGEPLRLYAAEGLEAAAEKVREQLAELGLTVQSAPEPEADMLLTVVPLCDSVELELPYLLRGFLSPLLSPELQAAAGQATSIKKLLTLEELLYEEYALLCLVCAVERTALTASPPGLPANAGGRLRLEAVWFEPEQT